MNVANDTNNIFTRFSGEFFFIIAKANNGTSTKLCGFVNIANAKKILDSICLFDTKNINANIKNSVKMESTCPHIAELYIIAGLNAYKIMDMNASLKLPYFLTIRKINKAVTTSADIAGIFSNIVKIGELISIENKRDNLKIRYNIYIYNGG